MKTKQLFEFLSIALVGICSIMANNSLLFANPNPKKNLPKSSKIKKSDAQDLMQSANIAVSIINRNIAITKSELEAIRKKVTTKISDLCALSDSINETIRELAAIENDSDERNTYLTKIAELNAKKTKLAQENKAIEEGMREAGEKAEQLMEAATVSIIIGIIASNIQIASSAMTFIEQDNRLDLANLLKRKTPSASIEILEIIKVNGITLKIRTGKLTHCFSTKNLCNGKAYSIAK